MKRLTTIPEIPAIVGVCGSVLVPDLGHEVLVVAPSIEIALKAMSRLLDPALAAVNEFDPERFRTVAVVQSHPILNKP